MKRKKWLAVISLVPSLQSSLDFRSRVAYRSSDESWFPPLRFLLILTDQLGYQTPVLHTFQDTTAAKEFAQIKEPSWLANLFLFTSLPKHIADITPGQLFLDPVSYVPFDDENPVSLLGE